MRKFKGTPGPWEMRISESKPALNIVGTQAGTKWKIARLPITVLSKYKDLHAREVAEVQATSRLIAEAPELLKACIQLIDAPHHEHFATRLNDEEMKGLDAIKQSLIKILGE